MVDYCCSNSSPKSKFRKFYQKVRVRYWHNVKIVDVNLDNDPEWLTVCQKHPEAIVEVLYILNHSIELTTAVWQEDYFLRKPEFEASG